MIILFSNYRHYDSMLPNNKKCIIKCIFSSFFKIKYQFLKCFHHFFQQCITVNLASYRGSGKTLQTSETSMSLLSSLTSFSTLTLVTTGSLWSLWACNKSLIWPCSVKRLNSKVLAKKILCSVMLPQTQQAAYIQAFLSLQLVLEVQKVLEHPEKWEKWKRLSTEGLLQHLGVSASLFSMTSSV